ncbi:hypothetical protein ACIQU6_07450 [Streptomyces sp. NPDC090442]|uniref:hypothetical protein n=1 Tax=Streptomyces sp. NPDC090442 TaxID=3365962 RepID=UPI00380DF899
MESVTPQDTYAHIVGAFAFAHSWWDVDSVEGAVHPIDDVADDWKVSGFADDPYGEEGAFEYAFELTHADVMRALRICADKDQRQAKYVSELCSKESLRMLLGNADGCDFDAKRADEVVQVAVFGKVHYG